MLHIAQFESKGGIFVSTLSDPGHANLHKNMDSECFFAIIWKGFTFSFHVTLFSAQFQRITQSM